MSAEEFQGFLDNYDFDAFYESLNNGEWMWIFNWWPFWGIVIILLLLIAVEKTRDVGTLIAQWTLVGCLYFLGGVILKNSEVSEPGPFIVAAVLGSGAAGYFIYTNLFKSG